MWKSADALASSIDAELDVIDQRRCTDRRYLPSDVSGGIVNSTHRRSDASEARDRAASLIQGSFIKSHDSELTTYGASSAAVHKSPMPRQHQTPRSASTGIQIGAETTSLQRERVESILRGFSSSQTIESSSVSKRCGASHSNDRSHCNRPRSVSSSLQPSSSVSLRNSSVEPTLMVRGTVDQVLISESQNEVVSLRESLIKATDALHRSQTELRSEQYRCSQLLDDIARLQRDSESSRLELSQLQFDLDAARRADQRNSETNQETISHLNRLVDQQTKQIKELMMSQDGWQRKCKEKDDDLAMVLSALQRASDEQQELRSTLSAAEQEHHRLLRFVEGPLASFAKDAQTLRSTWSALEVSQSGAISHGLRTPRSLEQHRSARKRQHHHTTPSSSKARPATSGRKLVEKLITDHNLERQVADLIANAATSSLDYSLKPDGASSLSSTSTSRSSSAPVVRSGDDSLFDDDL